MNFSGFPSVNLHDLETEVPKTEAIFCVNLYQCLGVEKDFFSCLTAHPLVYASQYTAFFLQQSDVVYLLFIKTLYLHLLALLLN